MPVESRSLKTAKGFGFYPDRRREDLEKYENPTLAQKIGQIPALEEELAYICKKAPEKDKECASYSGKSNQYEPV